MKKLLLVLAIASFSNVFSQTEAGKFTIGAASSLGFASVKPDVDNAENTTAFDINPQVGYFVIDNLALGLEIDFESSKTGDLKESTIAAGPFARYYFLESNIKPFLQAEFLFGSSKEESGSQEFKVNTTALGITGGVAFFLNDNISIDAGLGYVAASAEADRQGAQKINLSGFGLEIGFGLFF